MPWPCVLHTPLSARRPPALCWRPPACPGVSPVSCACLGLRLRAGDHPQLQPRARRWRCPQSALRIFDRLRVDWATCVRRQSPCAERQSACAGNIKVPAPIRITGPLAAAKYPLSHSRDPPWGRRRPRSTRTHSVWIGARTLTLWTDRRRHSDVFGADTLTFRVAPSVSSAHAL